MKQAILAALAVLGLSPGTTAFAPPANGYAYLFAPNQNSDGGGSSN